MSESEREKLATRLAGYPTKSTESMWMQDRIGSIEQMLEDLLALATKDGCIAAAWALEVIPSLAAHLDAIFKSRHENLKFMTNALNRSTKQRDRLLESCEALLPYLEHAEKCESSADDGYGPRLRQMRDELSKARADIADILKS